MSGFHFEEVTTISRGDFFTRQVAFGIDFGVRLGDVEVFVSITTEILDFVGHASVGHLAVGCLDEAEFVDAGKGAQGTDKADVRTFGSFNRADTSVV